MTALLVTAILFLLAGFIFGRQPLAEAYLTGLGVVGGVLFFLGLFHVPFALSLLLVTAAGLVGAVRKREVPRVRFGIAPTIAAAVPLLLLAVIAGIIPLHDWDGRTFWLLKAKALAHEGVIDGPLFHNQSADDPRNQYPLLMPLDAASVMIVTHHADDREVRWLYLFTFVALVFHLRRKLALHVPPGVAAWCAAILAWTPQGLFGETGGALSAYSDLPLAAFTGCAFCELLEMRAPLRFGFWLACMALTKAEGLPIAILLLAIACITWRRRAVRSAAPLAAAVLALMRWHAAVPVTDEENFIHELPRFPTYAAERLLPAIVGIARHAATFQVWGLFWIAALIGLLFLARRREWPAPLLVGGVVSLYVVIYVITIWPMADLIKVSIDRLLTHIVAPAMFAVARLTASFSRSR